MQMPQAMYHPSLTKWINETGYNMQELLNGEWIKAVHP
jgi:hypothetical protein